MKNTSSSNSHVALIVIGSFVAALQIATLWQLVELRMDRHHGMKPMDGKGQMGMGWEKPTGMKPGIAVGEPNPSTPSVSSTNALVGEWTWKESAGKNGIKRLANPEKPFVLTITADMKLSVKGDCNSMFGSYTNGVGGAFTVGPLGMTKMFCEGSQEDAFASELSSVKSASVQGKELILLNADGGMTFTKK